MSRTAPTTPAEEVARAAERLRLAESRLSRRRQNDCGPSENARAAMRYVYDRADSGDEATPTSIAEHLGISTAAVTGMLDRLHAGGLLTFRANPRDGRSKLVVPMDRSADVEEVDPVTAQIRRMAEQLSDDLAREVADFLAKITKAVDRACA
jgi:DNA-binding MarR family transcriptional regulator